MRYKWTSAVIGAIGAIVGSTTIITFEHWRNQSFMRHPGGVETSKVDLGKLATGTTANTIDVVDFGAKCDHISDDAPAINRAISYAISLGYGDWSTQPVEIRLPSNRKCVIKTTLNFTGFKYVGARLVGGYIYCQTIGSPCIDALGARFIHFIQLTLVGHRTLKPTIGIQIGRTSDDGADGHLFEAVAITGYFSVAAYYNFASEVTQWIRPYIVNHDTGDSYAIILDGYNHWNISSTFVSQTLPQDSPRSFNDNLFVGGYIQSEGSTASMWIGGTGRLKFDHTYSSNNSSYNVVLWFKDNDYYDNNSSAIFDTHFETPNVTDIFFLTGLATTPLIRGFRYNTEHAFQASNSIFKIDPRSRIKSVSVQNLDVGIGSIAPNNRNQRPRLFDDGSQWTVSGRVAIPIEAMWTSPTAFSGILCRALTCTGHLQSP